LEQKTSSTLRQEPAVLMSLIPLSRLLYFLDPLKASPNHDNFRACDWTYVLYDHRAELRRAATSGASGRLKISFHSRWGRGDRVHTRAAHPQNSRGARGNPSGISTQDPGVSAVSAYSALFGNFSLSKKGRLGAELKAARRGRLVRNDAACDQVRISFHSRWGRGADL